MKSNIEWKFWGENDPFLPRVLSERFGTDDIISFPNSGHWPQVEEASRLAIGVKEFLNKNS